MTKDKLIGVLALLGIPSTLLLFIMGHIQAGYWFSGVVVGLSFPSVYDFWYDLKVKPKEEGSQ